MDLVGLESIVDYAIRHLLNNRNFVEKGTSVDTSQTCSLFSVVLKTPAQLCCHLKIDEKIHFHSTSANIYRLNIIMIRRSIDFIQCARDSLLFAKR